MVGKSILGQLLLDSSVWHGEVDTSGQWKISSHWRVDILALAYTHNCTNKVTRTYHLALHHLLP